MFLKSLDWTVYLTIINIDDSADEGIYLHFWSVRSPAVFLSKSYQQSNDSPKPNPVSNSSLFFSASQTSNFRLFSVSSNETTTS